MEDARIQVGPITLIRRPPSWSVRYEGKSARLPQRHFDVLWYLAERKDTDVPKEEMYAHFYPNGDAAYRIIDVFVSQIRRKLAVEINNGIGRHIITVYGVGYRLSSCASELTSTERIRTGIRGRMQSLEKGKADDPNAP
jgi:DNA-binding response OmpR family regulator